MYHLSKELTGVLLEHDKYGNHLDGNGKTIDGDLEVRNFMAAGETLCKIWNDLVIDGYPTTAEYVNDAPPEIITNYSSTAQFRSAHVFESQYMVAYLKCHDGDCCSPFLTNVESFFPHRSLPPLIPIKKTLNGVEPLERENCAGNVNFLPFSLRVVFGKKLVPDRDIIKYRENVPYDLYLPSVQDKLEKRICKRCGKYHATLKSLSHHKKVCKRKKQSQQSSRRRNIIDFIDVEDEVMIPAPPEAHVHVSDELLSTSEVEDSEEEEDEVLHESNMIHPRPMFAVARSDSFVEAITNLREWVKSPWIEDDLEDMVV